MSVSTEHIEYLQRAGMEVGMPGSSVSWTTAPPQFRRTLAIDGVALSEKYAARSSAPDARLRRSHSAEVLVGLSGHRIPVAFLVESIRGELRLQLGTWSPVEREAASASVLERRVNVLHGALRSVYPQVDASPAAPGSSPAWALAGLCVGVPTPALADPNDAAGPLDRVVRGMRGSDWGALVLAEPIDERLTLQLRRGVINELRQVQGAQKAELAPSPLADHYVELLTRVLASLSVAYSLGAWRSAVYLLGDDSSYHRLSSVWRAAFAGEDSVHEPLRVLDVSAWSGQTAVPAVWPMPDEAAPPGPGLYRHPFLHQTLLDSQQLASYLELPRVEVPGFAIRRVAHFDAVPSQPRGERVLPLGRVVQNGELTDTAYNVGLDSLTRHALMAGVTGSGKTNSTFHLLREASARGVPFLVLEPAKAEYRALLNDPAVGPHLSVFTAGDERVSPLRLNPFEVPPGTSVAQHLDLLRAVFAASFGMWTPLPQVLERCLHEVYADRGWDLVTDQNRRARSDAGQVPPEAFPTLGDLVAKVQPVVARLGYEQRISDDIRAALTTRLQALRTGGKGRMLDVRRSIPVDVLLGRPTVIELEAMGDDDDKAFLMALLLVRLTEHRRAQGESGALRHLLVVEEAHRLLSAVPRTASEGQADARGKAVETFSQLLSEVRAYGQGVVIADQVPIRLSPDVIKNTGLKVAHRTVAGDDRQTLAAAMAMTDAQSVALTVLEAGEAAVFGIGDDSSLLVRMPWAKGPARPSDAEVAQRMVSWHSEHDVTLMLAASETCLETCQGAPEACQAARRMVQDEAVTRTFARLVLSTIEEAGALDRQWGDLVGVVRARRPVIDEPALMRSLAGHLAEWLAERRGAQAQWDYTTTREFSVQLRRALIERLQPAPPSIQAAGRDGIARQQFRDFAKSLFIRSFEPYPACAEVCDQSDPPLCLYRHWMSDLVESGRFGGPWSRAEQEDLARPDLRRVSTWNVAQDAGYDAIEFPEREWSEELRVLATESARRACLCFSQQMVLAEASKAPRTQRRIIARILREAGL